MPSLTALGGGIELYCRQVVGTVARFWPDAALTAALSRESALAKPALLDPGVRSRLRVVGTSSEMWLPRRVEMVARTIQSALAARPTLVVCGHVNYASLAYVIAKTASAPLVVLTYGIDAWNVRGAGERRALAAADLTISISSFTAAQLLRTLPLDPARLAVVPNAVDTTRFSPREPSPAVAARLRHLAHPRLLTVARLDASEGYKGVDQVIRAIARLPSRPSYLVVGEGSDLPRLRELATRLGVAVEFYGHAAEEDLADLYRACDLFVMPSRNEGFGYVFIEAMACGLPVVAGRVDGSVDALDGGRLGTLVDPFDVDQLARAIEEQVALGSTSPARAAERHAEIEARFGAATFERKLRGAFERLEGG